MRRACRALIAASLTLGSVAGMVAISPPVAIAAPAPTTLGATLAANPIDFDTTGIVRGRLLVRSNDHGLAGRTVALFSRAVGSTQWRATDLTARTTPNGTYEIRLPHRTSTRQYQVRFVGTATYGASSSPVRTLGVRAPLDALVMQPDGATAIQGTTRTWRGRTHRSLAGQTVEAKVRVNGAWNTAGSASIAATGNFAIRLDLWELGRHDYRVMIRPTLHLAAVASPARTIDVGTLTITSTSLPGATVGTAYSATLRHSFADPPVSWTRTGRLPSGLSFSESGVLSGTPTEAGSFAVTYAAADERGQSTSKRLTLTVADSPSPVILDSKLPAGQVGVGYAYRIRTAAGRAPFSWSVTGGTLPAGLTLDAATGLVSGTPTTAVSSTVTIRVSDADGDVSAAPLPITVGVASTWQQNRGDESQRAYVPGERSIDADTVGAVRREWTIPGGCCNAPSAIAGGVIYTGGPLPDSERTGITARDLRTGEVQWTAEVGDGYGGSRQCSSVAVTAASVICSTGAVFAAISRSGGHAVQWSTADTDPGTSVQVQMLVIESAGLVVGITGNNRDVVVTYRLSDGERMWQRNVDDYIFALAAGDGRLYVGTVRGDGSANGSLETFALNSSGTPGWSTTVGSSDLVAIDGAVLSVETNGGPHVVWRDANSGSVLRRFRPTGTQVFGPLAADASRVYVPTAIFDEFGGASGTGVVAVGLSDGVAKWNVPTFYPIRAGIAVGGSVVWIHASDLLRYRVPSDLVAVRASNGTVLRRFAPGDTSGYAPIVGGGRVLVHNSHGGEIYGTAPRVPIVATRRLPTGWTGSAYAATLAGSAGTAPFRWTRTAGSLPPGLALAANGTISGSPTTAGSYAFTVTVTDAAGVTATRELAIAVRTAAATSWPTAGGSGGRTGLAAGEASINSDTVASFGSRWTSTSTAMTGLIGHSGEDVVVSGTRAFFVDGASAVRAVDVTAPSNSLPLWTGTLPDDEDAVGTPALSGSPASGTLYVAGSMGRLHALNTSTGAISWSTQLDDDYLGTTASVLVAGGLVLVHTGGHISAVNASTHAIAWTHTFVSSTRTQVTGLATDGTRVFAIDGCHVVAVTMSTGAQAWRNPIGPPDAYCPMTPLESRTPVVFEDSVYAWTYDGLTAFAAATGAVRWRTSNSSNGWPTGIAATENLLVLAARPGPLSVYDRRTGALLGRASDQLVAFSAATIAGDVAFMWDNTGRVVAVDLLTLEQVWTSSVVGALGSNSRPVVNAGRVYVYSTATNTTQVRLAAFGPP